MAVRDVGQVRHGVQPGHLQHRPKAAATIATTTLEYLKIPNPPDLLGGHTKHMQPEAGGSGAGHLAARRPLCVFWARHVRQGRARAERSVRPGLCPPAGPRVANCWPLYKALKLSAMEIVLSDPNFRFYTESLTHRCDFYEDAALILVRQTSF